jgi:hypothetical protein
MITTLPSFGGGAAAAAAAVDCTVCGKLAFASADGVALPFTGGGLIFLGAMDARAGASSLRSGSLGSSARWSSAAADGVDAASLVVHCRPTTQPARNSKAPITIQPAITEIIDFLFKANS